MKNKKQIIILAVLILNLVVSGGIIGYLVVQNTQETQKNNTAESILSDQMETGEKYIIYIGTNDKDTYQQEIPTNEARDMVNAICAKYVEGYTASDAKGGWVDETDTLTQENTLVYSFYNIKEEQLIQVMDEVREKLNQNSILVERQESVYMYYYGNE
ncbi:MAG: DUF3574 domain-containing protein [Eubacterium sp.]|nr:DUF3574 domain-containing protein [Eubacterium sp.]